MAKIKKEHLINHLSQEIITNTPWIERKEIAAWSALIFYIGIYWAQNNFINDFLKSNFDATIFVITIIFNSILFIVFFAFIHSQYSAIYDSTAYVDAIRKILYELISSDNFEKLDFHINKNQSYPNFIDSIYKNEKSITQPFIGKKHPFKIMFYFWIFNWIRKTENRKIGNREKQEAVLYSVLVVFYSLSILILITRLS